MVLQTTRCLSLWLALLLTLAACGDDKDQGAAQDSADQGHGEDLPQDSAEGADLAPDSGPEPDQGAQPDAAPPQDMPPEADLPDMATAPDLDQADADPPPVECAQVQVTGDWTLDNADDVSIQYDAVISPVVNNQYALLRLLFERYAPGQDTGTFALGPQGTDENFGDCAHCVYLVGQSRGRVYFADQGSLELRQDPYSRRLDAHITGLRLIEVEVDPVTRASTPVPGGGCAQVADFTATGLFPATGWTCAQDKYNDGQSCECTCGAPDPDCDDRTQCPPFDPGCVTRDDLPLSDCAQGQLCTFDPELESTACTEVCDWAQRTPCPRGACIYSYGVTEEDTCLDSAERLVEATVGQPCGSSNYQQFCQVEDGFAMGYCGPNGVCRAVCGSDQECTEPGHTCRLFLLEGGLGYCGPEPQDG